MGTQPRIKTAECFDPPRSQRRSDAGVTLVEIMLSIVLMGVLMAALLAAVQVSIRSSSTAYTGAQVETVLINASDRVARAPQRCDYEEYVDAAALAEGWDVSTTTVAVEELVVGMGATPATWQLLAKSCNKDFNAFDVQRLTITATDPSGRLTRTLTVVKSDVN